MENQFTEMQDKWLKALESGEYRQVRNNLCKGGAYCCLGVATHIIDSEHCALPNNGWFKSDYLDEYTKDELDEFGEDEMSAPPEVIEALHLTDSCGGFRFGLTQGDARSLVGMNDDQNKTFRQIAALIREKPWLVFTNFEVPKP